jgi:hypothetical protein
MTPVFSEIGCLDQPGRAPSRARDLLGAEGYGIEVESPVVIIATEASA